MRGSSQAGNVAELGLPGGDDLVVDDAAGHRRLRQQGREDGLRVGGGIGSHRTASNRTDVRFGASLAARSSVRCDSSAVTARAS